MPEMASIRRTMSTIKREGNEQNEDASPDSTPSPKLPHHQSYFGFGRPKAKAHRWRKTVFQFSSCFIIGLFIGFTPFLSVEISHKSVSKHPALSFVVDSTPDNVLPQVYVEKPMLDTPVLPSNVSLIMKVVEAKKDPSTKILPSLMHSLDPVKTKQLIVVTPTYARPFQAYSLNRLAHTLKNIPPPILWIVVEMTQQSPEAAEILRKSGVMYRHLVCQKNLTDVQDRVIEQRNIALFHIEQHQLEGIVYFADDDNIYSLDLFDAMRGIRRFGTWPVVTFSENRRYTIMEGPVCNGSRVVGWHTSRRNSLSRRFHASMSGFAFNSTILWDSKAFRRPTHDLIRQLDNVKAYLQASTFIEQLVEDESQMEGLPDGCSEIMVWHLSSDAGDFYYPSGWKLPTHMESSIAAHLETAVR